MTVYLDNASTTPPDPRVVEAMQPYLAGVFGNPSSSHSFGRAARSAIELSRKKVADLLGASPGEIFFTSGGTEADNAALFGITEALDVKTIITSPVEHHAVLHCIDHLKTKGHVQVRMLELDGKGCFSMEQMEFFLRENPGSLVTLMHANNEIGNLTDIVKTGELCGQYHAYFHSDTVQTVGKIPINLTSIPVHSIAGSAHKFHGPKGVGFLYIRKTIRIKTFLYGGGQERNMRSGTENVAGIVGLTTALELACSEAENNQKYISGLKRILIARLKEGIPGVQFNGLSDVMDRSLFTILSVSLPPSEKQTMPLFQLDLEGIAVSGGSACASGALAGSHVLAGIHADPSRTTVRFSFSRFNREEEVMYAASVLAGMV